MLQDSKAATFQTNYRVSPPHVWRCFRALALQSSRFNIILIYTTPTSRTQHRRFQILSERLSCGKAKAGAESPSLFRMEQLPLRSPWSPMNGISALQLSLIEQLP